MNATTRLRFTLGFNTPAFLGNAEQSGQWRTPPLKALLRQWWRVWAAREASYGHRELREREGRLLGHAWLKRECGERTWAARSRVRLRLEPWSAGTLGRDRWPGDGEIEKVTTAFTAQGGAKASVRADVYLGIGPIGISGKDKGKTTHPPVIGTRERAALSLLCPTDGQCPGMIEECLRLMHWLGALGSRARNGWGSLRIEPADARPWPALPGPDEPLLRRICRPWQECLRCEWPHAVGLGEDGRALLWVSEPLRDWRQAIGLLANVRVAARRAAKQRRNGRHGVGGAHLLGYPAGKGWEVRAWGAQGRLASPLRFKVAAAIDGRPRALVFHMPCGVPRVLKDALSSPDQTWLADNELAVWRSIHDALDATARLRRLEG